MFQSLHCNKLLYLTDISTDDVRLETGRENGDTLMLLLMGSDGIIFY